MQRDDSARNEHAHLSFALNLVWYAEFLLPMTVQECWQLAKGQSILEPGGLQCRSRLCCLAEDTITNVHITELIPSGFCP
eukprot:1843133-Amphidinium_carterae.1